MRARRGSALIVVLWCLFFLSGLAVAIYTRVSPQIGLVGYLKERAVAYSAARAGVKQAVFTMDGDETQDYDALNDTWADNEEAFKDIRLSEEVYTSVKYDWEDDGGETQTRYGLVDEERKININTASFEALERFLESVGQTTSQQATDIANSILDWVDEDDDPRENGAEDGYYVSLNPGYPCANAKFQVLEELLLVKGMTREIFDNIKAYITVHSLGRVNLNTAGRYVLEALGLESALADKVLQFRRGNDGQEGTLDDNIFQTIETAVASLTGAGGLSEAEIQQLNAVVASEAVGVRSDHFYGESWGELRYAGQGGRVVSSRIVFIFDRDKNIRFWREE